MRTAGYALILPVRKKLQICFGIVHRDLEDAWGSISTDWRFGIAYNAALKLCTILLYAEGYRPEKTLQHYRAIQSLPVVLGNRYEKNAKYLDACRSKRNIAEYDYVGGVTEDDVEELVAFVNELREEVLNWLRNKHPECL